MFDPGYGRIVATKTHYRDLDTSPGSLGDVFTLIRQHRATSRSAISRLTGLSPSTAGLRVEALLRTGLVAEDGSQNSGGGRRARSLHIVPDAGFVVAVEAGMRFLRLSIADLTGRQIAHARHDEVLSLEPSQASALLWQYIADLIGATKLNQNLLKGIAVGLPAPIDYENGQVASPSFMPAWHKASLPELLGQFTPVPILVENDANIAALAANDDEPPADYTLTVLLGTRIGAGIIAGGRLLRGHNGAAGDFSHTAVDGAAVIPCICGIPVCLEAVASGAAIAEKLRTLGYDVNSLTDIVNLGRTADSTVLTTLREAGAHMGTALSGVVNFFNPRKVLLAGMLSASPPFVAAIRAELFQKCTPLTAQDLEISAVEDPESIGVRGAVKLLLDEVLAPARIDRIASIEVPA